MEQWLVIVVNDASVLYQLKWNFGSQAALKGKWTLTVVRCKSLPHWCQVWLRWAPTYKTAVACQMFPSGQWNKMLQEINDLQSFFRRGGLELVNRLKAIPCFAFTKANLSCFQSWIEKQDPFYLHSLWIVPPAWESDHPRLPSCWCCSWHAAPVPPSKCGVGRHPNILD